MKFVNLVFVVIIFGVSTPRWAAAENSDDVDADVEQSVSDSEASQALARDQKKSALRDSKDAAEKEGKRVTVCARVFSIKSTDAITQLSLGGAYPNNPMTVVIFAKNYSKFDISFEDLYKNRNITVKGMIETYKGKQQIIIDEPSDITVL